MQKSIVFDEFAHFNREITIAVRWKFRFLFIDCRVLNFFFQNAE